MHVIQQIAITAESAEEAMNNVKSKFDETYSESEGLGGWSDWYVVGGGRWNSNPSNQYQDSHNDVVSYDSSPSRYLELVQETIAFRIEEMERIKNHLDLSEFDSLVNGFISGTNTDEDRFNMIPYYVATAAKLLNGEWNQNSYFYDLENYTTTPKYMYESIDKGNKNWYLVPVDFHF